MVLSEEEQKEQHSPSLNLWELLMVASMQGSVVPLQPPTGHKLGTGSPSGRRGASDCSVAGPVIVLPQSQILQFIFNRVVIQQLLHHHRAALTSSSELYH